MDHWWAYQERQSMSLPLFGGGAKGGPLFGAQGGGVLTNLFNKYGRQGTRTFSLLFFCLDQKLLARYIVHGHIMQVYILCVLSEDSPRGYPP